MPVQIPTANDAGTVQADNQEEMESRQTDPLQEDEFPVAPPRRRGCVRRETADLIAMILDAPQAETSERRAFMNAMGMDPDETITLRSLAVARMAVTASKGNFNAFKLLYDIEKDARQEDREIRRMNHAMELERKRYELEYEKFHQNDVDNNLATLQGNLLSIAELLRQPVPNRTIEMIENAPDIPDEPPEEPKKTSRKTGTKRKSTGKGKNVARKSTKRTTKPSTKAAEPSAEPKKPRNTRRKSQAPPVEQDPPNAVEENKAKPMRRKAKESIENNRKGMQKKVRKTRTKTTGAEDG